MKSLFLIPVIAVIFGLFVWLLATKQTFSLTADCATTLPVTVSADAHDTFYHVSVPNLDRTKDTVFYACAGGKATKVLITAYGDVVPGIPIDVSASELNEIEASNSSQV